MTELSVRLPPGQTSRAGAMAAGLGDAGSQGSELTPGIGHAHCAQWLMQVQGQPQVTSREADDIWMEEPNNRFAGDPC